MQQVETERSDFLVVALVGGDVSVFAVADEAVGGVPVFDHVESFVDPSAQLDQGEVVAQKRGAGGFAEFVEGAVGRMLDVGVGRGLTQDPE